MKIIVADPAKNITVFVLDCLEHRSKRAALARAILAEKSFGAEQVGFVIPSASGAGRGLWHLEMAGGEFCGNAARSFGLYVARQQGLRGKAEVLVSVSGANGPVRVEVDTDKNRAAAEMPKPQKLKTLDYEGLSLPVVVFEGITHIIAAELEAASDTFHAIKSSFEKMHSFCGEELPAAFGVMFCDTAAAFMRPAVYVRSIESLVFESSCGSGSAALGVWFSRDLADGAAQYGITQPGGIIETTVAKKAGELVRLSIGGEVKLGEAQDFLWHGQEEDT